MVDVYLTTVGQLPRRSNALAIAPLFQSAQLAAPPRRIRDLVFRQDPRRLTVEALLYNVQYILSVSKSTTIRSRNTHLWKTLTLEPKFRHSQPKSPVQDHGLLSSSHGDPLDSVLWRARPNSNHPGIKKNGEGGKTRRIGQCVIGMRQR